MAIVLVLVPTLGREHLAFEELDGRQLLDRAVSASALNPGAHVTVLVCPEFEPIIPPLSGDITLLLVDHAGAAEAIRALAAAADVVVVSDPLCPLVPTSFISTLVETLSLRLGAGRDVPALIATRRVVDTLKRVEPTGLIAATVDRETVRAVLSPVVTTGRRLNDIPDLTAALSDPALLVRELQLTGDVELVSAPESARRVGGRADLLAMSGSSPD